MKKIRTGVFGGSFNPVHIGHTALANWMCEFSDLDEVWFLVSPHNPLKPCRELLGDDARLRLVRKAVEGYSRFGVCDIEFGMPRPSYTINTLSALEQMYPDRKFVLIIGADNWIVFDRWYRHEEILKRFEVLIYSRMGIRIDASALPDVVHMADTPMVEVSSSFIRSAIREGRDVRYFMHPAVWDEIEKMHYYKV